MGTPIIKLGIYEHFKGNKYKVLGVVRHSESLESLVLYQALYGEKELWVRPLRMFTDSVDFGGKKVTRFKYIG
ncbi:MAG: DUF1653 domain-containing protein [Patescibacteria group bacterium]|nr:DUF1653 domain-containing protein [Patescibacteria group bacterium]MDE2015820.1 DUF1653 domain-containing protein [Patescibacteria group bacterium]MDE2227195.1 DUF1653 domain-containing protein [Patescibacteria group bacterium]